MPKKKKAVHEVSDFSVDESESKVEKILGKRSWENEIEYLVKWKNCPLRKSTWEPLKSLSGCKKLIQKYEELVKTEEENDLAKKKRTENYTKLINYVLKKEKDSQTQKQKELSKKRKRSPPVDKPPTKIKKLDYDSSPLLDCEHHSSTNASEEMLSINSISWVKMIDEKLQAQVHYTNQETNEDATTILTTEEIAEIAPKKLIEFYESKINFTSGKGKAKK